MMAKRRAKGTLKEAANFLANEAEQLAILSLLVAINDQNLAALQAAARGYWKEGQAGWYHGGGRYLVKKMDMLHHIEPGVLSGGWKAYRYLEAADITLREYRRARPRLVFTSLDYSAKELRTRKEYAGEDATIPAKPWRNWPQRYVPIDGEEFVVPAPAAIQSLSASEIKDLNKQLPLAGVRINFKRLTREGRRIGTIRKKRAKIQTALRRAIENAV